MSTPKPHLLVVDDDDRLRSLLTTFLQEQGYWVSAVADTVAARAALQQMRFDLMVLDVMLPGESGVDFAKAEHQRHDMPPILMLTALGETEDRISGLTSGAEDYLTKPFDPRELVLRIQKLLRRTQSGSAADQAVIFGPYRFDTTAARLFKDGAALPLTTAEEGLLKALCANPGTTISRDALALALGTNERSIDVQVVRLRKKLEENSRTPQYLITVRGEGYVLRAVPSGTAGGY